MSVRIQQKSALEAAIEEEKTKPPPAVSNVLATLGTAGTIVVGLSTAVILFLNTRYKVSKPDQYLVRTGLGISDMSISRKAIVWPFQSRTISQFC